MDPPLGSLQGSGQARALGQLSYCGRGLCTLYIYMYRYICIHIYIYIYVVRIFTIFNVVTFALLLFPVLLVVIIIASARTFILNMARISSR